MTVAVRVLPVWFVSAVMMILSGEVPLTGATASQLTPSLTVQLNDVSVAQFVTLIKVVSRAGVAPQLLGDIDSVGV